MRGRPAGRRAGLLLVLAGLAGLLAAVVTLRAAADPAPGGTIVVARQTLGPGLLVDASAAAGALAVVPLPEGLGLVGVLTDPAEAVGRRVAVPVAAGEPLTQASLGGMPGVGPEPLAVGERAVPVPLSAAGGAGAGLVTGARVDVVASTGEGPAGRTEVIVADAQVLAVAASGAPDGVGGPGEALLRVSSQQALRITAALNFAREVRLLIRPADEVGAVVPRTVAAP